MIKSIVFCALTCLGGYSAWSYLDICFRKWRRAQQTLENDKEAESIEPCNKLVLCGNHAEIKVCTGAEEVVEGLKSIRDHALLGLDCEWRPKGWKRGHYDDVPNSNKVAVLQIASPRICLIIQMLRITAADTGSTEATGIPQELYDILASQSILKVGFGIHEDCRKLLNDYGLRCSGLVDLRHLSRREGLRLRGESLQVVITTNTLTHHRHR